MNLGQFIKNMREEKNISVEQMSKEIGLSKSYISKLENGYKDNPSLNALIKLSDYFRIPFSTFKEFNNKVEINDENNIDFKDLILDYNYLFNGKMTTIDFKLTLYKFAKEFENYCSKDTINRTDDYRLLKLIDEIRHDKN